MKSDWFDEVDIGGRGVQYLSKFVRRTFDVSPEFVKAQWPQWLSDDRQTFAAAFAERTEFTKNDREILDFLMDNGDAIIWRSIAILTPKHNDRVRAVEFLLQRIQEHDGSLANYYQALSIVGDEQCVPFLIKAMSQHTNDVKRHLTLQVWDDRFVYLDYLSCSATLFAITHDDRYKSNVFEMLNHSDEDIRELARMVANSEKLT